MLGVVVIALAFVGAFGVSYVAGIETSEQDVVKYNYLADVSGLFQYDKSPNYIEFDPSSNYVGYHSDDYINEFGDFWPEPYIDYVENERINNYRVYKLLALGDSTASDISSNELTPVSAMVKYVYDTDGSYLTWLPANRTDYSTKAVNLKQLITSMNLTDSWNRLYITLGNDVNWDEEPVPYPGSIDPNFKLLNLNTILILQKESSQEYYVTNPNANVSDIANVPGKVIRPFLSFEVDLDKWIVNCYRTIDYSGQATMLEADEMIVCYGDSTAQTNTSVLNLDNTMNYTPLKVDSSSYLNPNYGVWMKDE